MSLFASRCVEIIDEHITPHTRRAPTLCGLSSRGLSPQPVYEQGLYWWHLPRRSTYPTSVVTGLNTITLVSMLSLFVIASSIPGHTTTVTTSMQLSHDTIASDISLVVEFDNGTIVSHEDLVGTDVLNVTQSVFKVDVVWYGDLAFVTAIADVHNDAERDRWWQYWINDVYGTVAANKYLLHDGDVVTWRLTGSAFEGGPEDHIDPTLVMVIIGLVLVGIVSVITLYTKMVRGQ